MTETAERIVRIETKVDGLIGDSTESKRWQNNHLEHHRKYMYLALTTCIGLIVTLITLILKLT